MDNLNNTLTRSPPGTLNVNLNGTKFFCFYLRLMWSF